MVTWVLRSWPVFGGAGLIFLALGLVYAKPEWAVAGLLLGVLAARLALLNRAGRVENSTPAE